MQLTHALDEALLFRSWNNANTPIRAPCWDQNDVEVLDLCSTCVYIDGLQIYVIRYPFHALEVIGFQRFLCIFKQKISRFQTWKQHTCSCSMQITSNHTLGKYIGEV